MHILGHPNGHPPEGCILQTRNLAFRPMEDDGVWHWRTDSCSNFTFPAGGLVGVEIEVNANSAHKRVGVGAGLRLATDSKLIRWLKDNFL